MSKEGSNIGEEIERTNVTTNELQRVLKVTYTKRNTLKMLYGNQKRTTLQMIDKGFHEAKSLNIFMLSLCVTATLRTYM